LDLADIYGRAEDLLVNFGELNISQALTKWVPQPQIITRSIVNESIQRSLRRMDVDSLDLVQLRWWDYNNPYYMDALKYLSELRDNNIDAICTKSNNLFDKIGDCGDEYR
jgi:aryl-alcohol dehydrogenase-like predicted oxidoreductase